MLGDSSSAELGSREAERERFFWGGGLLISGNEHGKNDRMIK